MKKLEPIKAWLDSPWSWLGVTLAGIGLGLFFAWLPFPQATVQLVMLSIFVPVTIGLLWAGWNIIRVPLDDDWEDDSPTIDWMNQEKNRKLEARS